MYDTDFFKLCGFEPEEIKNEMSRLEKAFKILGISPEDVQKAKKIVSERFDTELEGVRKVLGIWIKELIALVLAKEEKERVIYTIMPSPSESYQAIMLTSKDVYAGFPDYVLVMTMGAIFNKLDPILAAAEEHGMNPGVAHCTLNETRLGAHVLGIIPRGDLSLAWGIICDEGPKTEEFIHEVFGLPVQFINRCQDSALEEFPSINPSKLRYWTDEMKMAHKRLEDELGIELKKETMIEAFNMRGTYMREYLKIVDLMARHDPVPLSQADLMPFYTLLNICIRDIEGAIEAAKTLYQEVRQRVEEGRGVVEKGAPKVLCGSRPPAADPGILRMLEKMGVAIPVNELGCVPMRMLKPVSGTEIKDPEEIIARRFMSRGIMHGVSGRISDVIEICKDWNLDGIFWYNHFMCRWLATDAMMVKKAVKEQLGIPMLILEGDLFSTKHHTTQQMKTRIEAFAEMIKIAKASKGESLKTSEGESLKTGETLVGGVC